MNTVFSASDVALFGSDAGSNWDAAASTPAAAAPDAAPKSIWGGGLGLYQEVQSLSSWGPPPPAPQPQQQQQQAPMATYIMNNSSNNAAQHPGAPRYAIIAPVGTTPLQMQQQVQQFALQQPQQGRHALNEPPLVFQN
eukprot:Rhum_TRINITY_DN14847_c2_g1::Rhum_TRINITY_DN14847_c2_g1_i1::g.125674::m.125674